jgi:putative endonuclease
MFRKLLHFITPSPAGAGAYAENLAAQWLRRERGFVVVARNWRNPRDQREELDLVCRDGDVLVFVEVKARSAGAMVPGYFAVDPRKKRVLLSVSRAYLHHLRPPPRTYRFDIVEVTLGPGANAAQVLHFENVALFPKRLR